MYIWEPSRTSSDFSSINLQNPIYGFSYDKNPVTRSLSATDTEGFVQFQPSLLEHKNDSNNIEYNPLDVYMNAMKYQSTNPKPKPNKTSNPKKAPNSRTGYILYNQEMRPSIQRRNPDLAFGEVTKIIAQSWNELSSVEQENYSNRARLDSSAINDNNNQDLGNQEMYFNMDPHQNADSNIGDRSNRLFSLNHFHS